MQILQTSVGATVEMPLENMFKWNMFENNESLAASIFIEMIVNGNVSWQKKTSNEIVKALLELLILIDWTK